MGYFLFIEILFFVLNFTFFFAIKRAIAFAIKILFKHCTDAVEGIE